MFKQVFLTLLVVSVGFSVATPQAHAIDISAALTRMDAIIVEMQSLRAEFATLVTTSGIRTATPAVLGSVSGGILGNDIVFGSTNDDIRRIQAFLATDSTIYPYGVASGFFGPKTREAVRSFQARFDLDTVGVVGPSTKALLEVFFAAYPDETYPADLLKQAKPTAQPVASAQTTSTIVTSSGNGLRSLLLSRDDDEYLVRSYSKDGSRNRDFTVSPDTKQELIEMIADKLGVSESEVESLIDDGDLNFGSTSSLSTDANKNDAEDALEDADDVIDKAKDDISDAKDDGDDVDDADELYDEARDYYKDAKAALQDDEYDEAVDLAKKAEELAEEAIDELDSSSSNNDIDSIEVEVEDGEADVTVEYANGSDKRFSVDEDNQEDIIEEIADELDMTENVVEDLVEFEYGDIERITDSVRSSNGDFLIRVYFESDLDIKFTFDEDTDEDDIVKEIARFLNLRENDVEKELNL